ncbi:MAG TPA: PAS domain-containing protein [Nitrospiraceae bacterium]|nr:PAS domain-containing protein [Nitrospiraceae bacterium]
MGAASAATFLIILKFFIAPQSGTPWMVFSNRAISVFVVWATALLVLQRKRNEQTFNEQKGAFQLEIEERKCTQSALEQSNQRITHILLTVTDPFFALDREFRIVEANPQAEFSLKRSGPDLLGQSIWSVLPRGTVFESQFSLAMGGQEVSFETVSPLDKGHWVAVHAFPTTAGVSVYWRDTTEMKLLRSRASEQAQELREVKAALERGAQRHPDSN